MIPVQLSEDSLVFAVYVQPRSSSAAFAGVHLDALKIKLTAPPADGAANKQCCQMLAKALALPKSAVEIIGGQTGRHKRIRIRLAANQGGKQSIQALAETLRALAR